MMTVIGKVLAFVNLIIGIALVSWSVSLYTQRPAWFDAKPESVSPGHSPQTFAELKDEIDSLGRAATAASAGWGAQRKRLEDLEARRAERLKGYAERLDWARNGHPKNTDQAGFFEPVYESATGLTDLTAPLGDAIKGPDDLPLKGADKLGADLIRDVNEVVKQAKVSSAARDEFAKLGGTILLTESKLLKMGEIRDSVQAERFYLATFEVNVYETRETVLRRKRQLVGRLADLGLKP
jgi:hypothetical protein